MTQSAPSGAGALVLAPLGTTSGVSTAAFLAAFCSWVQATPSVSERYSEIYLLPSVAGDPRGDTKKSYSQMVNAIEGDTRAAASAEISERELLKLVQKRATQYRCGGSGQGHAESATILSVAHTQLAPYGVGLMFAYDSALGTRRGFFSLRGTTLATDVRRFAAVALADPSDAIAADAELGTVPESQCRGAAKGLCIYQPGRIQISITLRDSAYFGVRELEVLPTEQWTVARDGLSDPSSLELTPSHDASGVGVEIHARRPGVYTLTAFVAAKDLPQVTRAYPIEFTVKPGAFVIDTRPLAGPYTVMVTEMIRTLSHRQAMRAVPRFRLSPIEVTRTCYSFVVCWGPDTADIENDIASMFERYKMVGGDSFETLADDLRTSLSATRFPGEAAASVSDWPLVRNLSFVHPSDWQTAVRSAVSDDEIRDGFRRALAKTLWSSSEWCEALGITARISVYRVAALSVSRREIADWNRRCAAAMDASVASLTQALHRIGAFEVWNSSTHSWLRVSDGAVVNVGTNHWLQLNVDHPGKASMNKSGGTFNAQLVPIEGDTGGDPIELVATTDGGRNSLLAVGFGGFARRDEQAKGLFGGRFGVVIAEVATPFVEVAHDRTQPGVSVSFWCYWEAARQRVCRRFIPEIELAALFNGSSYIGSQVGARISVWYLDHVLGAFGATATAWGRVGAGEVNAGVGIGFGMY